MLPQPDRTSLPEATSDAEFDSFLSVPLETTLLNKQMQL